MSNIDFCTQARALSLSLSRPLLIQMDNTAHWLWCLHFIAAAEQLHSPRLRNKHGHITCRQSFGSALWIAYRLMLFAAMLHDQIMHTFWLHKELSKGSLILELINWPSFEFRSLSYGSRGS